MCNFNDAFILTKSIIEILPKISPSNTKDNLPYEVCGESYDLTDAG